MKNIDIVLDEITQEHSKVYHLRIDDEDYQYREWFDYKDRVIDWELSNAQGIITDNELIDKVQEFVDKHSEI